ncbi:MAG: hypothetical protein JXB49_15555 [Bacteroidales bacterium]|nr:hypothetical protein [Bacteroidales bacterium]
MKYIRLLIVFSSLIILALFYYFNSDLYLLKVARNKRELRIQEYDKVNKEYLPEGHYSFHEDIFEMRSYINDFGKKINKSFKKGTLIINFFFTSDEIIIDYPFPWPPEPLIEFKMPEMTSKRLISKPIQSGEYSHVREKIVFDNEFEYSPRSLPDKGFWTFSVNSWVIIDQETDSIILDVLEERKTRGLNKSRINLYIDENPNLFCIHGFETIGSTSMLYFENQVEVYLGFTNNYKYYENYSYPPYVYDIENYMIRKSIEDIFKNLIK